MKKLPKMPLPLDKKLDKIAEILSYHALPYCDDVYAAARDIKKLMDKENRAYKKLLRMADVPEFLIKHPEFIKRMPLTKEDIAWAKEKIAKIEYSCLKN